MTTKKITKEIIQEEVKKIPEKAKKEGWVLTFDKDEGVFFYSPNIIPKGSELHQITDEYSMYLDKNLSSHGIMIECYNNNFVKHHPEFGKITDDLFGNKDKDEIKIIDPSKNKEATTFQALFEKTLIMEVCVEKDKMVV
jgi:hypothetical protein